MHQRKEAAQRLPYVIITMTNLGRGRLDCGFDETQYKKTLQFENAMQKRWDALQPRGSKLVPMAKHMADLEREAIARRAAVCQVRKSIAG